MFSYLHILRLSSVKQMKLNHNKQENVSLWSFFIKPKKPNKIVSECDQENTWQSKTADNPMAPSQNPPK